MKNFKMPEIEIIEIDVQDVITTSGGGRDDETTIG